MDVSKIAKLIQAADSIVLSTHRQCDGDGLGSEIALYFALRKFGKNVRIINVDRAPRKYRFLEPDDHVMVFEENPQMDVSADLALIFDTNDLRLLPSLYQEFQKKIKQIAFIDHHPVLKKGPLPTPESLIEITAASTGEIAFALIKKLGITLDADIARGIYTAITFDTQLYRYIRNSPASHLIAAELLHYPIDPTRIHRHLFAHQTVQKMAFLAKALAQIEYYADGKMAVIKLSDKDLFHYNLEPDESRDVIDMVMDIEGVEAALLFREDAPNEFKLSFRSKGAIEVLSAAEQVGGGGHVYAAGAFVKGNYEEIKSSLVEALEAKLLSIENR